MIFLKKTIGRRFLLSQEPKRAKILQRLRNMSTQKLEFMINLIDTFGSETKSSLAPNEVETLYLSSIPGLKESLIKGKNAPISECVPENEVNW